jgi:hypothetical protein
MLICSPKTRSPDAKISKNIFFLHETIVAVKKKRLNQIKAKCNEDEDEG